MIPLIYDKNIFVNNIYRYSEKNNESISELENLLEVSSGYFSRMKGNVKNVSPSINTVFTASQNFSQNLRLLLAPFSGELTKSEVKLYNMFSKLIGRTFEDKIQWIPMSANDFSPVSSLEHPDRGINPLLIGMYDNDGNYQYSTYLSISKNNLLTKVISAVHAILPAIDKELHIIQIEYENEVYGYEIFLDYKPLFATTDVNVILETEVHSLYSIIEKYMKSGIISDSGFTKLFDILRASNDTEIDDDSDITF